MKYSTLNVIDDACDCLYTHTFDFNVRSREIVFHFQLSHCDVCSLMTDEPFEQNGRSERDRYVTLGARSNSGSAVVVPFFLPHTQNSYLLSHASTAARSPNFLCVCTLFFASASVCAGSAYTIR